MYLVDHRLIPAFVAHAGGHSFAAPASASAAHVRHPEERCRFLGTLDECWCAQLMNIAA